MSAGKTTFGRKCFLAVNACLLLALSAVTLYPFLYVLAASLSDRMFIMRGSVSIIPQGFNTYAYQNVFEYPYLWRSYGNTVLYMVTGTAVNKSQI